MHVAHLFHALQALDQIDGALRGNELAACVDEGVIFQKTRVRAGIPSTFVLTDAQVNRLRTLVS